MGRLWKLADSRPGQAIGCLLALLVAASCAAGVYARWHQGGFALGASIFGVVFFGLCAYSAGHHAVTGRHRFANLS